MEDKELQELEEFTLEDIIREFSDHPVEAVSAELSEEAPAEVPEEKCRAGGTGRNSSADGREASRRGRSGLPGRDTDRGYHCAGRGLRGSVSKGTPGSDRRHHSPG